MASTTSIRRFLHAFLGAACLFFFLVVLISHPTAAQEPTSPPPKGPNPTPGAPAPGPIPVPPSIQLDQSVLPKIEPQLLKKLLASPGEPASFIVYLRAQADIAAAAFSAQEEFDTLAKRTAIIKALQQTASSSQAGVLQALTSQPSGNLTGHSIDTTDIKPLWIINAVAAKGSLETVFALASRPDVEIVRLDKEIKLDRPVNLDSRLFALNTEFSERSKLQSPEWGISKIRADLVHSALNITGTGVVVANIDTGVDWLHPALQTNYRGYTGPGKLVFHPDHWFDAIGGGAVYPTDSNGHGTHTMGTAVGSGGIGVAPGAKWIAVRAFNSSGSAQSSWLHDAFQWLLAPNGKPELAPHLVNNSWSGAGFSTEFEVDVQALLSAGIFPVFAAGNSGPGIGTVGSPGSLNIAFAVGATTIDDEIANFSSRGPSIWSQVKPEVAAPGKNVRSALPGGAYGSFDGTSMATPHVVGLAALLIQASPTLTNNLSDIVNALQTTTVPLGGAIPNNDFGWGRVDAYNAVLSVASFGALQGVVTDTTTGMPVNNPLIQITPSLGGPIVNATGDVNGAYTQGLAANTYDVTASAFGYQAQTLHLVDIVTNTTKTQNFSLIPLPTGFLTGTVRDKATSLPLSATIRIDGTPVSTITNPGDGSYNLALPVGSYTITVIAAQHRVTKAVNINISSGITITQHFLLDAAPSILLVDSGRWYQESKISFYKTALDDALYPYDNWEITKPFESLNDIPTAADLSAYDIVIWSSPEDSPGFINADPALQSYLDGGGKLLLSGQDIAYFDGGGAFLISAKPYLQNYLKATYVQDNSGLDTIVGVAGEPFAGLSLSISGGDGANNQATPDVITNAGADFAAPLLAYSDNSLAGLHIDQCVPYRALFLSYGFEGINSDADRQQVMEQTINWLTDTPIQIGTQLSPETEQLVGDFGATVTHTVRLRNTGATTDVYTLTLTNQGPYNWVTSTPPLSLSLAACQSRDITITVQVPATKSWHISDTFTLAAQSTNSPTITDIATRATKTVAPVLLVDDDRWYSFSAEFKEALTLNNIPYDFYSVPESWAGPEPPSPPLETLQLYPMVVWYAAYDWFQPLTPNEENRLIDYLNGGGRLFYSGQDFLYKHLINHDGSYGTFAQDYLGVQIHTEDYTSTTTTGQLGSPVGAYLGPYDLTFPVGYQNWTDAITPTSTARIATVGQALQPNGLSNNGVSPGGNHWHTTFLAYGPELLPAADRARLMQRAIGWLSWLGNSAIEPYTTAVANGALITYTATISNDGHWPLSTAYFTGTFPAYLSPQAAYGGAALTGGQVLWNSPLAQNQSKTFSYTAQIIGPIPGGAVISQTSWLAYPEHNILFDRITDLKVAPALNTSSMTVTPTQEIEQNDILTYTIILKNSGTVDDPMVTTTNTLPADLDLLGIDSYSSGVATPTGRSFTWTTSIAPGQIATLTFRAVVSGDGGVIENIAYAQDNINETVLLSASAAFKTIPFYLPLIFKN